MEVTAIPVTELLKNMAFMIAGAFLDACVLGALSDTPAYGYELTQKAQRMLGVSETTLYPVLRRLLKDGLLTSYDEPFDGRNRRYYKLTHAGSTALKQHETDWQQFKRNIDNFLGGNGCE